MPVAQMSPITGAETFIAMTPEAIRAKEAIYKFDYAKRQCYLESDRSLHFFRHYSFLNCYMECSSNVTFQVGKAIQKSCSLALLDWVWNKDSVPEMRLRGILHAQDTEHDGHLPAGEEGVHRGGPRGRGGDRLRHERALGVRLSVPARLHLGGLPLRGHAEQDAQGAVPGLAPGLVR